MGFFKRKPKSQRSEYWEYLKSETWKAKRRLLFQERGRKCEKCGAGKNLNVHHLSYEHFKDEPLSDLQILCRLCHKESHGLLPKVTGKPKEVMVTKLPYMGGRMLWSVRAISMLKPKFDNSDNLRKRGLRVSTR